MKLSAVAASGDHGRVTDLLALRPEDWTVWRDLRLAALDDDPGAFRAPIADMLGRRDDERFWRERLELPGSHNVAAFQHGEPVGMVSVVIEDEGAHLFSMWVAPRARGTGVADTLIEEALGWARVSDAGALRLDVDEDNARAAAVYRRHGFELSGASEHDGCMRMRLALRG